ncbi:MAG TPA: DUF2851 family protein [bacterium]|nr:DUF2851 family protein [bacterium]
MSAPRRSPPTPAQEALLREVEQHQEPFLQAWWAHRLWQGAGLRTTGGAALEVLEPGWLNRGPGPDFTEARLLIDGREHWGDVEVHLTEDGWRAHGHHADPAYGRVILHVVLRRGHRAALTPVANESIPVLEAAPLLSRPLLDLMDEPELLLQRYEALPGRCGLRAALVEPEAVQRVVAHAAEARARAKAERILASAHGDSDEQLLFRQLFSYLGYRPHAGLFEDLARRFPMDALAPLLELPAPQARTEVLARWFGAAGFLEAEQPASADAALREEFAMLRARWRALALPPLARGARLRQSRPWNAPERRLAGLFHHLHTLGRDGWLRGWLRVLRHLDGLRDAPEFRRAAMRLLEQAFATPTDEPWRARISFAQPGPLRPARLIGRERVIVLMANAVLPTFLALARRDGDVELEKVLYRLYLVLPSEGTNQRIRFMERRLAPISPLQRTLRSHQGLLQIHQDFCLSFHEGCARCRLPDLIAPPEP